MGHTHGKWYWWLLCLSGYIGEGRGKNQFSWNGNTNLKGCWRESNRSTIWGLCEEAFLKAWDKACTQARSRSQRRLQPSARQPRRRQLKTDSVLPCWQFHLQSERKQRGKLVIGTRRNLFGVGEDKNPRKPGPWYQNLFRSEEKLRVGWGATLKEAKR